MAHDYEPYIRDDWSAEAEMRAQCEWEEAGYRYNHEIIEAFCDCCSHCATGTPKQLTENGWILGNGGQYCEYHRY